MRYDVIDTSTDVGSFAEAIANAGVRMVIRYFNHRNSSALPSKCLGKAEADRLLAANLSIAVIFQQNGGRDGRIDDFATAKAKSDAERSLILAAKIGQPSRSAIYFAVDHDYVRSEHLDVIRAYFATVKALLDGSEFRTGFYGSGLIADLLLGDGTIEHVWLSGSMGWSGTRRFLASDRWVLFQQGMDLRFPGLGFDYDGNIVNPRFADFGQFGGSGGPAAAGTDGVTPLAIYGTTATSLNVRTGPGVEHAVLKSLPTGTTVRGLLRRGDWVQVDTTGDGAADGFVHGDYLRAIAGGLPLTVVPSADATLNQRALAVARAELALGVKEWPGKDDSNPRIVLYHRRTVGRDDPDAVAWCSSFVNYCVEEAGGRGTGSQWALSWKGWGQEANDPQVGDVAVFERRSPKGDGGHVGFWVGGTETHVRVLGGNQRQRVCELAFPRDGMDGDTRYRLVAVRRG
jgi:uncharacterized protein (TIGR02594 family)